MNDDDQHTTNNEQSTDVPTDQQQYLTQLENRLSQLEDENKHLKSTVAVLQIHLAKYDKQMTQLQQDQRMIQDYIKSTIDRGKDIVATSPNGSTTATTTASQSNNNKTVAYFVLRANGTQTHTKPIESFLQSRFTHMTEYSHGSQYDLVFVIFYRSSGRLDHVTESTDLAMFKSELFVCLSVDCQWYRVLTQKVRFTELLVHMCAWKRLGRHL